MLVSCGTLLARVFIVVRRRRQRHVYYAGPTCTVF
jgi:hypothetical protein